MPMTADTTPEERTLQTHLSASTVKHIFGSFTLANPTSKRAVSDYAETQARDGKVLPAEKVKSQYILGSDHD